jgi:hypothetical protein
VRKLVVATTAGADDAMPARREKAIFGFPAGLTKEQVEAAEVHAAGSSHCGEIKSKSAFSRYSTAALKLYEKSFLYFLL